MRNVLITVLIVLCFAVTAHADLRKIDCDSFDGFAGEILNDCAEQEPIVHPEKDPELGVGADVIVYEGEEGEILNAITAEYRYDINNRDHKAYAVATTKLADVWAKLKGLFNKGE